MRTPVIVIAAIAATSMLTATATATPQQTRTITTLKQQVKRQQAAIDKRNVTIENLTTQRGTASAALAANATQQINAMQPADAWSLLHTIGVRLASNLTDYSVTFVPSNYGTWGSEGYVFTWIWGI